MHRSSMGMRVQMPSSRGNNEVETSLSRTLDFPQLSGPIVTMRGKDKLTPLRASGRRSASSAVITPPDFALKICKKSLFVCSAEGVEAISQVLMFFLFYE